MKFVFTILLFLCVITGIIAQTERQILPADMKQMTVVTQPPTLPKGFFRVGESLSYGLISGNIFDEKGKRIFLSESDYAWATAVQSETYFHYGINNRLETGILAHCNFEHEQLGSITYVPLIDTVMNPSAILKGRGLNQVQLKLLYQIIPQNKDRLSSLTGIFELSIPGGRRNPRNIIDRDHYDLPVSSGAYSTGAFLIYKKIQYPFSYSFELGYTYFFSAKRMFEPGAPEKSFKMGNSYGGSAGVNFHLNEWIALTNEVIFLKFDSNTIEGKKEPGFSKKRYFVEYSGYLVFHVKHFRISEGIEVPVFGKNWGTDPMYFHRLEYLF